MQPGVGNGQVWVVKREIVRDGTFIPYQEFLSGNEWIRGVDWYGFIGKQKAGIITKSRSHGFAIRASYNKPS
ncbi:MULTISPECIES: hypothetical protein [unclassified Flavobacterium]|uniref:hypothetical protein n=1 Tax=unclassified Flavobacterium TaxID=196869 RepID=UPI00131E181C|nr:MULTISPECIES: hypothetical protein [unclassified Flavobacterium]